MQALTVGFPPYNERKRKQSGVDYNGGDSVKRVEANRTPIGIVDRISQQMIGIDNYGPHYDQCRIEPAVAVECESDQWRDDEMQRDVDHVCDVRGHWKHNNLVKYKAFTYTSPMDDLVSIEYYVLHFLFILFFIRFDPVNFQFEWTSLFIRYQKTNLLNLFWYERINIP